MRLTDLMICDLHRAIVWKCCGAIGRAFIVFGATGNGGSFSAGQSIPPMMLRWRITTVEAVHDSRKSYSYSPGRSAAEEFLRPLGISQAAFARHIGVPPQHINEIVRQKRAVTPGLAWLLAQALGTSPEFWINLQTTHDLAIRPPKRSVARLAVAA